MATVLQLVIVVSSAVVVHTLIVNVAAILRTRTITKSHVEMIRLSAGSSTLVTLRVAQDAKVIDAGDVPDSSGALRLVAPEDPNGGVGRGS